MKFVVLFLFSLSLSANLVSLKINEYYDKTEILKNNLLDKNEYPDYEFKLKKIITGLTGIVYEHYEYYYKNIKVALKEVVLSERNGNVFYLSGKFSKPSLKSLKPLHSSKELFDNFALKVKNLKFFSPVEIEILIKNKKSRLTYTAYVSYFNDNGYHLGKIYIDSENGSTVLFDSKVQNELYREVYTFNNTCLNNNGSFGNLPGILLFTEGNESGEDIDALNAYDNSGITYFFYNYMFNRDSFENNGHKLISTVHVKFYDPSYGCHGYNASFIGYPYFQMLYGDGNPNTDRDNFSKALDVVAHELTHAVTDATSDLVYQDESGALNEALSDIFGATVEAWKLSGGGENGNPEFLIDDENTWKIGERIGNPIRYMNNPMLADQPDYYAYIRYIGTNVDNGGVHINSGIVNLAYYLLVKGGKHPVKVFDDLLKVKGLGLKKSIKIFYEAQTGLFTPDTDFEAAREFLALAAENLYGNCSDESEQVNRAFDFVGVPGKRRSECVKTCEELACNETDKAFCYQAPQERFNRFCKCLNGYRFLSEEKICVKITPCDDKECNVNSHCEVLNDEAVCICNEGYYLDNGICKKNENPCKDIDCGKGGVCELNNYLPQCRCNAGYVQGPDKLSCVKYVNPCEGIDCGGHGNCMVRNNEAFCLCKKGYENEGLTCIKKEIDLCKGLNCEPYGTCMINEDKAVCLCKKGYLFKNNKCVKEKNENTDKEETADKEVSSCSYYGGNDYNFLLLVIFMIILLKKIKNYLI